MSLSMVAAAEREEITGVVGTSERNRVDMVDIGPLPATAARALRSDALALAAITEHDLVADGCWDRRASLSGNCVSGFMGGARSFT